MTHLHARKLREQTTVTVDVQQLQLESLRNDSLSKSYSYGQCFLQ